MWGVRCVDETDALAAAEVDDFAVRQYARGTIRAFLHVNKGRIDMSVWVRNRHPLGQAAMSALPRQSGRQSIALRSPLSAINRSRGQRNTAGEVRQNQATTN